MTARTRLSDWFCRTGRYALFCFMALLLLAACDQKQRQVTLTGDTMGTTYHVTLVDWPEAVERDRIHIAIERILEQIDVDMSNYRESSVLSRFNRAPPGQWFPVSPDLVDIVSQAQAVSLASGGAYDITVSPLVDIWGFGPRHASADAKPLEKLPAPDQIATALSQTGFQYIQLQTNPPALQKQRWLELDLSSIAPGYAVDKIAVMLESQGVTRYLVEVGGELRVNGQNADGKAWVIGIEDPRGAVAGTVRQAVTLNDRALATSGNYRHFSVIDGVQYSHTIDPRSGMAVSHDLVSVTVLEKTAAMADAWATAYAVLGTEATLKLAEQLQQPVYLLVRKGDTLTVQMSSAMKHFLEATP